jgi:hypothetical protein
MKRSHLGLVAIALVTTAAARVLALGVDLTPQEIAQRGKHCVHGYWINERQVTFYAGDTAQLNRDLAKMLEGSYASRKVLIHAGTTSAGSPWDKARRNIAADWSVDTYDDPDDAARAVPRFRLQVDIWLGSKIKLDDLRIPPQFDVASAGEIEKFVQRHKPAQ